GTGRARNFARLLTAAGWHGGCHVSPQEGATMMGPRSRVLFLAATLLLGVGVLCLGVTGTSARAPDQPPPAGPASRTAAPPALLAFHEAQAAADVARMLLVAERLERIGEPDLAAHVRHVAREVAREAAREAAAPG